MKTADDIGWDLQALLGPRARESRWLKVRQPRVTGSVYGVLSGVNTYSTVWDLYKIKRGEQKPQPAGWNARRGQVLEPEILKKAQADPLRPWAFEVIETPRFILHPDHDLIGCSPDFLAYTTNPDLCAQLGAWPVKIMGEIKSRDGTKARNYKITDQWPGYTPAEESQVRFNMMCAGADVGLLVVQCIAEETIYRPIFRDLQIEAEMIKTCQSFLHCVKEADTDALFDLAESAEQQFHVVAERFEKLRSETLDLDNPTVDDLIDHLHQIKAQQKDLKAQEAGIKVLLAQAFEDYERIETPRHVATWKAAKPRRTFDTARLLSVFPGMNLDPYYKTSAPKGRGPLRIKVKDHD
tara:strand:+ start:761 stop:1816 length:1056 start_codon:yes stop_codon:yes gene_type:complete